MRFCFAPLFSGSSGNAIFIEMGGARLLVDAGVSCARIERELNKIGVGCDTLDALLVTHEHADHVSGAGVLSRKYNLPIFATEGTWSAMREKIGPVAPGNRRSFSRAQDFYIGRVDVTPFDIPHDAYEPVGYAFACEGIKASVATDIGQLKESWMRQVAGSDVMLLESNHDVEMLKAGRYPYELKRRILGRSGHLSNDDAALAAVELRGRGVGHIILGHLSGENNFPELAMKTVEGALAQDDTYRPGYLDIASRTQLSADFVREEGAGCGA